MRRKREEPTPPYISLSIIVPREQWRRFQRKHRCSPAKKGEDLYICHGIPIGFNVVETRHNAYIDIHAYLVGIHEINTEAAKGIQRLITELSKVYIDELHEYYNKLYRRAAIVLGAEQCRGSGDTQVSRRL